jgi:alpha-L-arabinofuranosidase
MKRKLIGVAAVIIIAIAGCAVFARTGDEPPTDAEITVDAGRELGRVNRLLFGDYVIAPGGGNGLVPAGGGDFDPQSLAMVKELSPTILRLGVLPVFEDALGDWRTRREARCGWESWHTNEYGLDEHMRLLEKIGAPGQALITVGYPYGLADSGDQQSCIVEKASLSQTVKRAAAWVAYANGDPNDRTAIGLDDEGFDWRTVGYWAGRRAKNGHPAPYGIRYWEIGNEVFYEGIAVQQYAADFLAFYDEMKRVDPQIVIAASARQRPKLQEEWNVPLLQAIGSKVDALALHMYYPRVDRGRDLDKAVMASATQADKDLAYTRELIAKHTARPQEIALILGENGLLYSGDYEDARAWNTLLAGLYDVDLIGTFVQRSADYNLALGIQHFLQGESPTADIMHDWNTRERYLRPDYYALQMWTRHFGDTLLPATVRSATFDLPGAYGNVGPLTAIPYLAAHASISDGSRLYLLVVNRNLTSDARVKISISDFKPLATGKAYTLNGPDIQATNEDGNHDTINIKESAIFAASREFVYTFPAHSATVLELAKM